MTPDDIKNVLVSERAADYASREEIAAIVATLRLEWRRTTARDTRRRLAAAVHALRMGGLPFHVSSLPDAAEAALQPLFARHASARDQAISARKARRA